MITYKYSHWFRIATWFILLNFLISQNLFAVEQIQLNQDTGNYQPVKPADRPLGSELPISESDNLPNPIDFLNDGPLSLATESLRGGLQADEAISEIASALTGLLPRNDAGYEFDIYSFENALDLIRPEFAAAIPMWNQFEVDWKCLI